MKKIITEKEKNYIKLLKDKKLKFIFVRLKILALLNESPAPISIHEIFERLGEDSIDQVTVYRILTNFIRVKIVRQLELRQGRTYFEILTKEHHHHLICEKCGKISELYFCKILKIKEDFLEVKKSFLKEVGFQKINSHSLKFYGICRSCGNLK